jgi:hypothetical protein
MTKMDVPMPQVIKHQEIVFHPIPKNRKTYRLCDVPLYYLTC